VTEPTIHGAKLPSTVALEDLLIRPIDGVSGAVDPDRAGWRYLSFRVVNLSDGESIALERPDQEAVVVTIGGGGVRVEFDPGAPMDLVGRTDVFADLPWAAYVPAGAGARLTGRPFERGGRSVVAYGQAPSSGRSGVSRVPVLITPDDVEVEIRGAGRATRQVNNMVMPDFPADRLLCCEVFTPAGNWSGWPPHKHDIDDMPREAVLEETYYYQTRPSDGFGLARLYFRDGRPDRTWAVTGGDVLMVTEGYHPYVAPPDYDGYYLNLLAGDRRTMQASDDPDIVWVRETWPSTPKDARLPLGRATTDPSSGTR
jgi:5-deoxy-glucuronate isomerase